MAEEKDSGAPRSFLPGRLDNLENAAAGLLMAALFVTLCLQVFTRYVLGTPLIWTEEAARYMFIALVFIGSAGAILDRSHLMIELGVEMLPARIRPVLVAMTDLLSLCLTVTITYWAVRAMLRVWDLPTPALRMPTGIIYAVVAVSTLLMSLRLVQRLWRDLSGAKRTAGR